MSRCLKELRRTWGNTCQNKKPLKTVNIADSKILTVQTFKEMAFYLISASSEVG